MFYREDQKCCISDTNRFSSWDPIVHIYGCLHPRYCIVRLYLDFPNDSVYNDGYRVSMTISTIPSFTVWIFDGDFYRISSQCLQKILVKAKRQLELKYFFRRISQRYYYHVIASFVVAIDSHAHGLAPITPVLYSNSKDTIPRT